MIGPVLSGLWKQKSPQSCGLFLNCMGVYVCEPLQTAYFSVWRLQSGKAFAKCEPVRDLKVLGSILFMAVR